MYNLEFFIHISLYVISLKKKLNLNFSNKKTYSKKDRKLYIHDELTQILNPHTKKN